MDPEKINNIDIEKRLTSLKTAAAVPVCPESRDYFRTSPVYCFLFHRKFNTITDTESNFFVIRYCNFRKINLIVSLFLDVL